jgi:hypothetical protein
MAELTKMYKVVYSKSEPVEVFAEIPLYPHCDSEGNQIFDNTHFTSLDAAWKKTIAEHRAGMSLAATRVQDLRDQLKNAESRLVEAALFHEAVRQANEDYTRLKSSGITSTSPIEAAS